MDAPWRRPPPAIRSTVFSNTFSKTNLNMNVRNTSKNLTVLAAAIGLTVSFTMMQSCSKDSSPAKMTLYDSLGGTTKVNDPANAGQMIEKGRLGLRSVVDSAIFVI